MVDGSWRRIAALSSALLLAAAVLTVVVHDSKQSRTELLSPLQVGLYAVRAERSVLVLNISYSFSLASLER